MPAKRVPLACQQVALIKLACLDKIPQPCATTQPGLAEAVGERNPNKRARKIMLAALATAGFTHVLLDRGAYRGLD